MALGLSLESPDFAELDKLGRLNKWDICDFSGERVCNDKGLFFLKLA